MYEQKQVCRNPSSLAAFAVSVGGVATAVSSYVASGEPSVLFAADYHLTRGAVASDCNSVRRCQQAPSFARPPRHAFNSTYTNIRHYATLRAQRVKLISVLPASGVRCVGVHGVHHSQYLLFYQLTALRHRCKPFHACIRPQFSLPCRKAVNRFLRAAVYIHVRLRPCQSVAHRPCIMHRALSAAR